MKYEKLSPRELEIRHLTASVSEDSVDQYVVKYEHNARNNKELTIQPGQYILVTNKDPSGWWQGELMLPDGTSQTGLFPYNYVELAEDPNELTAMENLGSETKMDNLGSETTVEVKSREGVHTLNKRQGEKKGAPRVKNSTAFRMAAHLMAKYGCVSNLLFLGLGSLIYGAVEEDEEAGLIDVIFGMFGMLIAPALFFFEHKREGAPLVEFMPARACLWMGLALPCFFSFPLITAGLALALTSLCDVIGFFLKEKYVRASIYKRKRAKKDESLTVARDSIWRKLLGYYETKKEEGKIGRIIFCTLFFLANAIAFSYTAIIWTAAVDKLPKDKKLSSWAPYAKAFGAVIDLDASLILMPVCRTLIRMLYNMSSHQTKCASFLRYVFWLIPIDKNHWLHMTLAKLTLVAVIGHTMMHFINYSLQPEHTVDRFGMWPFVSGIILLLIMMVIYTGGLHDVRRAHFELFWYSHHFFFFFYLITLVHGAGGWNPNFWKFLAIPAILYAFERLYRALRSFREVRVHSVMLMEPRLLSIEMDKDTAFGLQGFREGQYVFVNCPSIAAYEWHPFTISSPPQNSTFTLHIQTQGPGSWTLKVRDYLASMGSAKSNYFKLSSRNSKGAVSEGRSRGPRGERILLIDGPHSAPTQHMGEYRYVMVAGAGIGVTPVAACVQSVVFHRWKFSFGESYPSHAHFYWVVSHRDVQAYKWFVARLKEVQDCVKNLRKKNPEDMKNKSFRFHIFVTSVPKESEEKKRTQTHVKSEAQYWGVSSEESQVVTERATFSKMDLFNALLHPKSDHVIMDDIHIWKGRPKWDDRFMEICETNPKHPIGVLFCGNKFIASDLKKMCHKYSSTAQNRMFRLHKENF